MAGMSLGRGVCVGAGKQQKRAQAGWQGGAGKRPVPASPRASLIKDTNGKPPVSRGLAGMFCAFNGHLFQTAKQSITKVKHSSPFWFPLPFTLSVKKKTTFKPNSFLFSLTVF